MATALVSSDYRAYWVASDCTTVIMGVTDAGVLETLAGFNIDIDFTTGSPITVDINVPLASDTYVYGLDIDLQQTAAYAGTWSTSGGMIALRSDVHVDMQITDAYAGYFSVYVDPAATCTVNDAVGVLANVTLVGPFTQGASTSSIAALKGMISNTSTGSYDGQVYNVMLSYGSNVNYGDDTALIMGYTHADARCDYGFYLKNYSPYMVAGIYLTEVAGASPVMGHGILIDGDCTTAAISIDVALTGSAIHIGDTWAESTAFDTAALSIGGDATIAFGSTTDNLVLARYDVSAQIGVAEKYFIGEYKTYATSGAGAGTVLQYGIWMGDYCGLTIAHNTTDAYATRGRTSITGTMAGNQFIGVMGQFNVSGAATLEATGGGYGVYGSVTSDTSGACNRNVAAGMFTMRPNTIDLVGDQSCVVADMGGSGYADYGFAANVGNNNTAAAIRVQVTDSAVLPIGILFTETVGSITKLVEFPNGAGMYYGTANPNGTLTAEDGSVYFRSGTGSVDTVLYTCSGTNVWTALTTT